MELICNKKIVQKVLTQLITTIDIILLFDTRVE